MNTYVTNGFSPSMLKLPADVEFKEVGKEEFCEAIGSGVINAIGHKGTVDFVNALCDTTLTVNRTTVRAKIGDTIYMLTLALRLEEGKVLTKEEVVKLYEEGKVLLLKAKVYSNVLEQLAECQGVCEEREYDALAYKAKNSKVVKNE